jgi:hypothetical protein
MGSNEMVGFLRALALWGVHPPLILFATDTFSAVARSIVGTRIVVRLPFLEIFGVCVKVQFTIPEYGNVDVDRNVRIL